MDSQIKERSSLRIEWWVLLAVVLIYLSSTLYKAYGTPLRDIPGPWLAKFSRFWLFNAIRKRDFHMTNVALHRKYGPIVRVAPNEYSIDDPEAAQVIYRSRDQLPKAPWYSAFANPSSEAHVFATTNVKHHAGRLRQVKSVFQIAPLMKLEHHIDDMMVIFLNKMDLFAKEDRIFDLAEWFQLFSFDTVGSLTFGKPFGVLEAEGDVDNIIENILFVSRYGAAMGVFHEWNPYIFRMFQPFAPKGAVGIARVEQFTTNVIEEWQQKSDEEKEKLVEEGEGGEKFATDLLGSLLAKHRSSPENFTIADAYYHIIPNVLAGGHTTGTSFAAIMHSLMKDSRVLNKLRQILEQLVDKEKTGFFTAKETMDCEYLQAVIKEAMRLFPAVGNPMVRVVPAGGLDIAGRRFPAGSVIGINTWVAHINPSVFGPDAEDFRPERWLEDHEKVERMEQYLLTFGKGPRSCLGRHISLMEMNKLVAELVMRFDFELADPKHNWTVHDDWFVVQSDFQVRVRKRSGSVSG